MNATTELNWETTSNINGHDGVSDGSLVKVFSGWKRVIVRKTITPKTTMPTPLAAWNTLTLTIGCLCREFNEEMRIDYTLK